MSREDIVAIASRLFAIFLGLTAIRIAAVGVGTMLTNHAGWTALLYPLPAVLACLVPAFLLWYFPLSIARKLLPAMRDSGQPITLQGKDIQAISLTILGVWVLAQSISDAAYWVALVQFMGRSEYPAIAFTPSQKASIVRNAIEFALGVALLLGSRGLLAMLHRLRYGALQHQEPKE
jgi:hypothetical protein